MARVILASYMVRYPLGGNLSAALQWLVGLRDLGHDVYMFERSSQPDSCYDPVAKTMSDDCTQGTRIVSSLLQRHGLDGRWCFVDQDGVSHGMQADEVRSVFRDADVLLDHGTHGAWLEDAAQGGAATILLDGEPGTTQIKFAAARASGGDVPRYDSYVTVGCNVPLPDFAVPAAGVTWRHAFHPVVVDLLDPTPPPSPGRYTTVLNWRSRQPIVWEGVPYGMKDAAFDLFAALPSRTAVPLELAVSGRDAPLADMRAAGWHAADAQHETRTVDSYLEYIARSRGEFSMAKQTFVALRTGWFSDRSGVYLGSGKPVVLQDTGFASSLPCGEGLFAVADADSAAAALDACERDYERHARRAREIACDVLEARRVIARVLDTV